MKLPEQTWFTVGELALRWGVAESYVEHMIECKKLKAEVKEPHIGACFDGIHSYANESPQDRIERTRADRLVKSKELLPGELLGGWPAMSRVVVKMKEVERFESEAETTSKQETAVTPTKESPRVIENLQKALIAVAMDCYGYDPAAKGNTAVTDIQKALDKIGLTLSENTIRDYLKKGAQLIPQGTKA